MERLLQDATALSGVEYDISSFADIVDAIHVVQGEMGISGRTAEEAAEIYEKTGRVVSEQLGTTAKEAETTIQGSVATMKSAWANLLTGMSDENADMDTLITNFVGSVGTVAENVMPKVSTALNSVSKLIGDLIPVIVKEIPKLIKQNLPVLVKAAVSIVQSLVDGIAENQDMIMEVAIDTIIYLVDSFIGMLPQIVELGLQLIISLANGIADSLPELIPTIIDVVLQIYDTLTNPETLVSLIDAALAIIIGLADGLVAALPQLIEAVPVIIGNLVEAILLAIPELMEAAISLITGGFGKGLASPEVLTSLLEGVAQMIGSIIKGFLGYYKKIFGIGKEIFTNIKDGFMGFIKDPVQWGKDLIDNFIGGIKEKWDNLKNTVSNVAGSIKDFLGFSEPKKGPLSNFHTYAPDMMDLFAKGIKDNESVITNQIEKSFDFGERTIGFSSEYTGSSGGYGSGVTNLGGVTINVNGANYTDERSLAEAIAEALQNMTDRKAAIYA